MPATVAPVPPIEQADDAAAVRVSGAAMTASGMSSRVSPANSGTAAGAAALHSHLFAYARAMDSAVPLIAGPPAVRASLV